MNQSLEKYTFGMIGLGTMGRNLLLNMADHDFAVAGYDKDATKGNPCSTKKVKGKKVKSFSEITAFVRQFTNAPLNYYAGACRQNSGCRH